MVREDDLAERSTRLLPFAFRIDVRIVSPPVVEYAEHVGLVVVIGTDPPPRLVVKRGEFGHRRRAKLRIFTEERDDLERVEIANKALTAAPVVAVACGRNQVPPELHLLLYRMLQFPLDIVAPGDIGGVPAKANVFV